MASSAIILNYKLPEYSYAKSLLWGNFLDHCKQAKNERNPSSRFVHILIALAEFLPIIGQIASIFEKIIVQSVEAINKKRIKANLSTSNQKIQTFSIKTQIKTNSTSKAHIVKKIKNDFTSVVDEFSFVENQQIPNDLKETLGKIFKESDVTIFETLERLGFETGITDNIICEIPNLNYMIKFQNTKELLNYKNNLFRVVMNNKIKECVSKYNMKHITCVEKYIYKLPSAKDQPLNDSNAVVIAEKVNVVDEDTMKEFLKNLNDEQYQELLTVIMKINYADFRCPNITLVEEGGQVKIAFLDTEDIASKFVCTDDGFRFYLNGRHDTPWHGNENSQEIVKIARGAAETNPEASKKILKFLLSFHRGLHRIKPEESQSGRVKIYAKMVEKMEKKIQSTVNTVTTGFKVKLQ